MSWIKLTLPSGKQEYMNLEMATNIQTEWNKERSCWNVEIFYQTKQKVVYASEGEKETIIGMIFNG